ncbi:hypothetical protein PhCBS80983_g05971 [Powellomyces hirtus]|uniref:t-SNARE coiled-coil homology domain-containing protein n=1 Tax=Powellomyces hirtus TaxID=109895 RepID=A0A507DS02_9FUNG|nr:hypothetical protein PhCBS80983_g05971 [Powellomyces hirtus]
MSRYNDNNRYENRMSSQSRSSNYNSNGGGGDYGRRDEPSGNRWAAAAAQAAEHNHSSTGYRSWETVDEEPDQYDDEGWLDRKTTKVQNDSLMSSRRALARLNEADDLAMTNLGRMNAQGEQLNKINSRLESAGQHAKVADAKTDHLKSLNKFFFLPSFGAKKAKRREDRVLADATANAAAEDNADNIPSPSTNTGYSPSQWNDRQYGRTAPVQRSSTPANINRDATEEEIDSNIDQISAGLSRLKMMSQSMNSALDQQSSQIRTISGRSDSTNEYLRNTTRKINSIR